MAVEWETSARDRGWRHGPDGSAAPRVTGAPCLPPGLCRSASAPCGQDTDVPRRLQIDYYCRLDCLWKKKFKKEHEEFETMENVNRLLLENVLPAHVAAHFIGDKLNEVRCRRGLGH